MSPLQNSLTVSKSLRFPVLLKYSPASCIFQFNSATPSTLHPSSRTLPSHFGSRQLRSQPAPWSRDVLSVIPAVNRPEASFGIAGRFHSLIARFPGACVHRRPGSYRLPDHPNLCAAEISNLVTASTDECSQKLLGTALTAGSKISSAVIYQCGSKNDMPEPIVEAHAEQLNHFHSEEDRSGESIAGKVKKAEECGLSVDTLGKLVEDENQSLDHLRAESKDQIDLIRSTLPYLTALNQAESRIKEEASKHEESSGSEESVTTKLTKDGHHPNLKHALVSNSQPENTFNEGACMKSSSTYGEHLDRNEESVANTPTKNGGVSHEADISAKFQPPSWPEWRFFLQHLKSLNFLREDAEGCNVFDDPTCLKRAFYKFSQAHETVLESLSHMDLQVLALYGCPNTDRRTVAAGKRLRNYFQIEERRVCSPCTLQSSCESAFVKPANVHPKLSDVMRLIYGVVVSGFSQKNELPDSLKSSIIHLLQEITIESVKNHGHRPESESKSDSSRQHIETALILDRVGIIKDQQRGIRKIKPEKEMKEEGLNNQGKVKTEGGVEAVFHSEQQKCSRYSFVNLEHEDKCAKSGLRQSGNADIILNLDQKTTPKLSDEAFSIEANMKPSENSRTPVLRSVDKRLDTKHNERLAMDSSVLQQTTQERDCRNDYLSSTAREYESDLKKIELRNGGDFRTSVLRRCVDERLATKDKERLKLDSCALQQTTQEQDGRIGHLSSSARKDESDVKKIVLRDGSDSDKEIDIFDDIGEAENSNVVSQTQQTSAHKNSLSELVRENMDSFYPQRGKDDEGIGCGDDSLRRGSGTFRGTGTGNEEYHVKPRYAFQRDDEVHGWGYNKESPHRSGGEHYTLDSQDSRRQAQGGGQGAKGSRVGFDSDDGYCHSDRATRGNRLYPYKSYSEDEKGSRGGSYSDDNYQSPHRSGVDHYTLDSRDSRGSYDSGRHAQGRGQGAKGSRGGSYSDDSYCHSDRATRRNRLYPYRSYSEDERGSRGGSYSDDNYESPHGSGGEHYILDSTSRDSRCSYDSRRRAQSGGQGAKGSRGGSYSDDSYCHSDSATRGNRLYPYRSNSEDEKGSRGGSCSDDNYCHSDRVMRGNRLYEYRSFSEDEKGSRSGLQGGRGSRIGRGMSRQ